MPKKRVLRGRFVSNSFYHFLIDHHLAVPFGAYFDH